MPSKCNSDKYHGWNNNDDLDPIRYTTSKANHTWSRRHYREIQEKYFARTHPPNLTIQIIVVHAFTFYPREGLIC